jgi:hypothetical protein
MMRVLKHKYRRSCVKVLSFVLKIKIRFSYVSYAAHVINHGVIFGNQAWARTGLSVGIRFVMCTKTSGSKFSYRNARYVCVYGNTCHVSKDDGFKINRLLPPSSFWTALLSVLQFVALEQMRLFARFKVLEFACRSFVLSMFPSYWFLLLWCSFISYFIVSFIAVFISNVLKYLNWWNSVWTINII